MVFSGGAVACRVFGTRETLDADREGPSKAATVAERSSWREELNTEGPELELELTIFVGRSMKDLNSYFAIRKLNICSHTRQLDICTHLE